MNQMLREEKSEKILEAARTVFARKGMAATMAEVAEEAGDTRHPGRAPGAYHIHDGRQ